jgi:hypothetical protein
MTTTFLLKHSTSAVICGALLKLVEHSSGAAVDQRYTDSQYLTFILYHQSLVTIVKLM